jgi:hypothetical protein
VAFGGNLGRGAFASGESTDILEWANGRFYPNIQALAGARPHCADSVAGVML